jgi:hypothetical protein
MRLDGHPLLHEIGPADGSARERKVPHARSSAAPRWIDTKGVDMNTNAQSGISIVTPRAFDTGTSQTPGSERLAAMSASHGIASPMWGVVTCP